jgi:hypothetical protein
MSLCWDTVALTNFDFLQNFVFKKYNKIKLFCNCKNIFWDTEGFYLQKTDVLFAHLQVLLSSIRLTSYQCYSCSWLHVLNFTCSILCELDFIIKFFDRLFISLWGRYKFGDAECMACAITLFWKMGLNHYWKVYAGNSCALNTCIVECVELNWDCQTFYSAICFINFSNKLPQN